MDDSRTQGGNVLFLILIAVALFAALSYAITQSSRSGGSNGISPEKARLAASEIVQYAGQIEQAIMRMRLINRCLDTQISFENPFVSGYTNTNAPSDKRCHVFDVQGGGVPYRAIRAEWLDENFASWVHHGSPFFARALMVDKVGSDAAPPAGNDLPVMFLYLKQEICSAINAQASVATPTTGAFYDLGTFAGTYQTSTYGIGLSGRSSGCVYGQQGVGAPNSNRLYGYVHVLLPR